MTQDFALDCAYQALAGDVAIFRDVTDGLPSRDPDGPYHSGAHCVRVFRDALTLAGPAPHLSVLEIGFNLGHSAAVMLSLGVRCLLSIEVREDAKVDAAAAVISARYGKRFRFLRGDSTRLFPEDLAALPVHPFTFAFIDGSHERDAVVSDIRLAQFLGCVHYLLDDWHPHFGAGVQEAAEITGLVVRATLGAMALCVPRYLTEGGLPRT